MIVTIMIRKWSERLDLKWKFDLKSKLWNPKSPLLPPHNSELLRFPECPAFDLKNDDKNQFMWTNQKNCKLSFQNTFNRNTKNKYFVQIWHWFHLVAEIHHGPKIPGNNSFNAYFLLWQVFLTPYDMTLPIPIIITYIRLHWLKSVGFPKSIFCLGDMVLENFF